MAVGNPQPLRRCTFLLVEDDADSRDTVRSLLEGLGAHVRVAADGLDGLVQLARGRPDAVLCDLIMPVLDGWGFARRMRGDPENASVILVAVTGREDAAVFMRSWEVGFDAHLVKPITPATLEAIVRRVARRCGERST